MRIFTEKALKEYIQKRPETKTALQEWASIVKKSEWECFDDVRKTFTRVSSVGKQHYVFDILGNSFRLVVVIKFTVHFVYIRFVGTHQEYDKIKADEI
jgi:mRNA interferase HigB